jgi:hypothetical protein
MKTWTQSMQQEQHTHPAQALWAEHLLVQHAMTHPMLPMGCRVVVKAVSSSSRGLVTSMLHPGLEMTHRESRMW